jgi:predicted DNA-binding transcriptional regulator AlpA
MAHPSYLREKARAMRAERRLTIDELAERLALPRSTIYYWVRDMPIPGSGPVGGWPASAQRNGTRAMKRKFRLLREAAYREGVESYPALAQEPTFRDFVCLYIAEGYKRSRHTVSICNSDPSVMLLSDRWIRRLTQRPVNYAVTYHPDQQPEQLIGFWSGYLGVPAAAVRCQRKTNSGQLSGRVWRCRHGVMAVASHDTYFRARLAAWVDLIKGEWAEFPG